MGIVATTEQPPEISPEAHAKAAEMRAILNADLQEAEIAAQVKAFRVCDVELECAAWSLLVWKEQDAWRQYRGMRLHQD